jgi:hypothetical protein
MLISKKERLMEKHDKASEGPDTRGQAEGSKKKGCPLIQSSQGGETHPQHTTPQ